MLNKFKSKNFNFKIKSKENIVVQNLPYNPMFEKFQDTYLQISSNQKKFVLLMLKYTEKGGSSLRSGVVTKIKEAKATKNFILEYILLKVLYYMDIRGLKIVESMYLARLINKKEHSILLAARNFATGIDQITNIEKRGSALLVYNLLLLGPAYLMLVILLATHDLIKSVLEGMVKPMIDAGGHPPPLPDYMTDPTMYIYFNAIAWTFLSILLGFYYFTKHYNIPTYFKVFKLNEQELVLSVLDNIDSLLKSGINITDSVKILMDSETHNVKKELYEQIYHAFLKGNIQLSVIFEYYNVNYQTIGLISMGEETNNIIQTLEIAKSSLEETYNTYMKAYAKISFYGGQILMGGVILKPIIDILLYTSIQQLNFTT